MKLKTLSCLAFIFSFFLTLTASAADITGKVTDAKTNETLPGAVVSIPDLKLSVPTDANGTYRIKGVPSKGRYLVQVTYVGYQTATQVVDLTKTQTANFALSTSSIETETVVVTGVSHATELKKNPIPMVAVSKTYLDEKSGSGNIIDAIANLPGINAVTTGPNISKPFIHGLGYNRVITLMDGIRQEGQQWGDEHGVEVDQNSVDRVEVIKGPASLSFGSDAIGGVVNLISPAPVTENTIKGEVMGLYGTNQGLFNNSLKIQGNQNGLIWGVIGSAKEAKDYQDQHDGRVYNTAYRERDLRGMFGVNKTWGYSYFNASLFDDQQEIPDGSRDPLTRQFTKQITEDDTFRPIVSQNELNSYTISPLHQHVQLYRIYNNSNFNIGKGSLVVNLGYQFSHRREYTHPEDVTTPGLNLHLSTTTYDFKYNFDIAEGYETTFGLNGMYQKNSIEDATEFPIPAYHQFDIGPFFVVKKSYGDLDLSAGARFDNRSFNGDAAYITTNSLGYNQLYTGSNPTGTPGVTQQFSTLDKNFSGFSGSVGGTYNVSKEFLFKANIARGFRAPSIAELSANGPDPGSQIYHKGNTNFKPEFSLQEDIGAFLTLPMVTASVEVFNNDLTNYIYQQQILDATGQPVQTEGYDTFTYVQSKARIYGGEASLDLHPMPWLHFENSASLTYGRNLGNGGTVPDSLKYLPFIPPLHTHHELRGNFTKGFGSFRNMYVSVGLDHYSAQDRFFAAYGTETYTAGYNLISAGVGTNIINSTGRTVFKLFIEGTNLGNVNYQSNMSRLKYFDNPTVPAGIQPGIFNMGRNITFKVVIPFDFKTGGKNPTDS